MELVIDANILFAGLIKDSTTASLIFNPDLRLYSPEFIVEEFIKYSDVIQKKMKRTKEDFISIMHLLYQIITVIPENEYANKMEDAKKISPDNKDVPCFALALIKRCAIWSNDNILKNQNQVKVYSTKDLLSNIPI
ncbi:MAG: PIN domain-containing protein [Candidatus Woesearchaeota archaeon]